MVSPHHLSFINSVSSLFKKKFRYNVQRLEMIMWNIESFRQQKFSTEMLHTFLWLLLPTSPQLSSPRRIFSFLSKGACLCVHLVLKYLLLWLDNRWEKSSNKYFPNDSACALKSGFNDFAASDSWRQFAINFIRL